MNWSSIANTVTSSLPILGTALGGPIGGAAGSVIAKLLGVEETPDAVLAEIERNPAVLGKLKAAEIESNTAIIIAAQAAETEKLRIVNETIRNESNSNDTFVRRWRPFYGYCVALSWFLQMTCFSLMFAFIAIKHPQYLSNTIQQFAILSGALLTLWGVALAVLGVSVHKRSMDKKLGNAK